MTTISNISNSMWNTLMPNKTDKLPRFNAHEIKVNVPKITGKLANIEDLIKTVKEEQVKNQDGTVTTIKTNGLGMTIHITKRKDKNGIEYEERIQKNSDGSLQAKTIKKGDTSKTEFFEDGKVKQETTTTYKPDGKTVKTEDTVIYDTTKNEKVVLSEEHKNEKGDVLNIHYDLSPNGKASACVKTKENGQSVEKHYDITDSQVTRGEAKLDKDGNILTLDNKNPQLTYKTSNKGLPTETTSFYTYNKDGTVTERIVDTQGKETFKLYNSEEDLKNGKSAKFNFIGIDKSQIEKPKVVAPNSSANKPNNTQESKQKSKAKTGYTPKVGAQSRYHKGFKISQINDDGTFLEKNSDGTKYLLCNKNGEVMYVGKYNADGSYKLTRYKNKQATNTWKYDKEDKNTSLRQHKKGITSTPFKTSKGEELQKAQYDDGRVRYFKRNPKTKKYDIECDKNGNPLK